MTTVAIIAIAAVVIICYAFADPIGSGFAPRCFFKSVTGYDCPGCGFQRALSAALHGDFVGAWHYNPFIFFAIPVAIVYVVAEASPARFRKLHAFLMSLPVTLSLLVIIILWWILRNLL